MQEALGFNPQTHINQVLWGILESSQLGSGSRRVQSSQSSLVKSELKLASENKVKWARKMASMVKCLIYKHKVTEGGEKRSLKSINQPFYPNP